MWSVTAALTFTTLLASDRIVFGPAASALLFEIEEVKKDVEAEHLDDLDAIASCGISITPSLAAGGLDELPCDLPSAGRRFCSQTRGPPTLMLLSAA